MNRKLYYTYDDIKNPLLFGGLLIVINLFFLQDAIIYYILISFIVYRFVLYRSIGNYVDEWFFVKKYELPKVINTSIAFTLVFVYIHRSYTYDNENFYYINIGTGAVFLLIALLFLALTKDIKSRKRVEDFPNLKQERMYDNIDVELNEVFEKDRVIKKPRFETLTQKKFFGLIKKTITRPKLDKDGNVEQKKLIDYKDTRLKVTDDRTKNILPEVKQEIIDIINGENLDFYNYSLTFIPNEVEADKLLKILMLDENKMVKSRHRRKGVKFNDGYRYMRFWYKMMQDCFKELSDEEEKIEYDLKQALEKFDGILEYAFLDMFVLLSEYKNRPIGNSKALAKVDCDFNKNQNVLELCGAMDSVISTSVKRCGIAYYYGYYATVEKKGYKSNKSVEDV